MEAVLFLLLIQFFFFLFCFVVCVPVLVTVSFLLERTYMCGMPLVVEQVRQDQQQHRPETNDIQEVQQTLDRLTA